MVYGERPVFNIMEKLNSRDDKYVMAGAIRLDKGIDKIMQEAPKFGGVLIGGLIGLVLCEIILLIFRVDQVVTCWIAAALFSLYIGYDIHRSQQFAKTVDNAVDSALDIYLDVANLFIRLMEILGKRTD